jgi:hypothetical protein
MGVGWGICVLAQFCSQSPLFKFVSCLLDTLIWALIVFEIKAQETWKNNRTVKFSANLIYTFSKDQKESPCKLALWVLTLE